MDINSKPGDFMEKFPMAIRALRKLKTEEAVSIVDVALYMGAIGAGEMQARVSQGLDPAGGSQIVQTFGAVLDSCLSMDTTSAALLIAKDYANKVTKAFSNVNYGNSDEIN